MHRFSTTPKGADELDNNPTEEEMRLGFSRVREAAENGKLRKAKVAYVRDEHDNIVKIVVVFDSKEYDAARDYLKEDHMPTEPLRPIGNAKELLADICAVMKIANMGLVKEEIDMEEKRTEEQMTVEEAVATTPEASANEGVEEVVAKASVNGVTTLVTEAVVDEEAVTGDAKTDVETEPAEVKTGENLESDGGCTGMRITGLMSSLDADAIISDLVSAHTKKESKPNVEKTKSELKSELEKQYESTGTKFLTPSVVRLTKDDGKIPYLTLCLKKDKKSGDRIYHLDEIIGGVAQCQNSTKADFSAAVLRKQGVALEDFIVNRQGDYSENINDILSVLQCIEENRLLAVDAKKCINHEILGVGEFMERLKIFLKNNPLDARIAYIQSKQSDLIGVVGRGPYTAYQNFKRLVAELAPENEAKHLKDNLFANDYFETDSNNVCKDCQKTLSEEQRKNTNIRGDKMYAFKFDEDFMAEFKTIYERESKTEKANQEAEQKKEK